MVLRYFLLVLVISLGYGEHPKHSSHVHHDHTAAENKESFDHEAILGSKQEEAEFEGLSPEESKRRLLLLAKRMDANNDGFVSEKELTDWIVVSFRKLDEEEAKNQIRLHDEDYDGKVTFKEFVHKQYGHNLEDVNDPNNKNIDDDVRKKIKDDELTFKAADRDHDGVLTLEEYPGFEFPYEYSHMHETALNRAMDEHDKNRDGFVSEAEFTGDSEDGGDKETFREHDKNLDGKLDLAEFKPWIVADNEASSKEEADHLISVADDNKDGKLDFGEIEKHHDTFVGSQVTNYGSSLEKTEL